MGRLFWKFFLLIGLVQLVSVLAVGASIYYFNDEHGADYHHGRPPEPRSEAGRMDRPPAVGRPEDTNDGGHARFFIPVPPMIGGVLTSLITAALLAWYLAKPIRGLRAAFVSASGGDLTVRVGHSMGRGNDEVIDLGREFDRMVERLHNLVDGQRRLLHDVSHEMRSPLARIQAALGLASQQPAHGAHAAQITAALERIDREATKMDRLVGELLALARLQAGFTGAMDEDIDLRELLEVIVDDARFEAAASGRQVDIDGVPDLVIRGNVELLRRALENVVRNAVKYSAEGGSAHIAARALDDGKSVLVSVLDDGPGVPAADLTAIFEPFFRSRTNAGHEGYGLGLAIAHRVVQAHGGTIAAANAHGGGLRVDIRLPVHAA
jgi:two-component system OmpR family sensor kinase